MMKRWWMWLIAGLVIIGYILPYTLFTNIEAWHGAFLFWIVFGVLVWLTLSLAVARWTADAETVLSDDASDRT